MLNDFPFYLCLTVAILFIFMLARTIKVAYPILLVLAGLGISFIPGIPAVHIHSELIFVIFLPPLLYDAAWSISWKELWKWRRIISSFAFVVVLFSAFSVALVSNYFIPGFSLALGFLLGGIVSPPDAVSAGAILKFVTVPKRFASILEGESLLNDASSLIIFRFAFIAVATGQFVWYNAALTFGWMVLGGIACGLLVGYVIMKMHKYLPTDGNIDVALTIVTPYIMYIVAEEIDSSGVLAVVSGGLLLSNYRFKFLTSGSRLRGANVWASLVFVLNGFVFLLIGLELPEITSGIEGVSTGVAIKYGLLVSATLIIARIISGYMAVLVTLIARNFIKVADPRHPGYKSPLLLGWSGMRGVVSLAAALSLPVYIEGDHPFPQRNLVLFITFIVILVTLLLQGLTLPYLIKKMQMPEVDYTTPDDEMYHTIGNELHAYILQHMREKYQDKIAEEQWLQHLQQKWESKQTNPDTQYLSDGARDVYIALLCKQREWLVERNKKEDVYEEVVRKYLRLLDIEQERIELL